jgi:hypothetical protein
MNKQISFVGVGVGADAGAARGDGRVSMVCLLTRVSIPIHPSRPEREALFAPALKHGCDGIV